MSLMKTAWKRFTPTGVAGEPSQLGVYELADENYHVIYINDGILRLELHSHGINGSNPLIGISFYKTEIALSKASCKRRKKSLLKIHKKTFGELPHYNELIIDKECIVK